MSEQLDRIERVLDNLVTNQINERESRLALREDLEILYQTVRQSTEITDRAINQLTAQVDRVTIQVERLSDDARQDREQMRVMQSEIQQIWQYLLSQSGNGHGGDR